MEQTTITRIGHATVLIELPHITILTDPVLFDRIGISFFGLIQKNDSKTFNEKKYMNSIGIKK